MSGFGNIATSGCKTQSKKSSGLVFWTISETVVNPETPPPPSVRIHYLNFNLLRLLESYGCAMSLPYYIGVENSDLALE